MFDGIVEFENQLVSCFGESGAEAFHDAIVFYLSNCKDFPCEEDKLVLLTYIKFSTFSDALHDEFHPLFHFSIKLFEDK